MKKTTKKNHIILFSAIILSGVFYSDVYANEHNQKKPAEPEPKRAVHNTTAIISIKNINCSKQEYTAVKRNIVRALHAIRYYVPVKDSAIQKVRTQHRASQQCVTTGCLRTLAREIPAHKLITGSIRKIEKERERLLGREGKEKYLLQTKQDVTFVITLNLIDGTTIKTIKRIRTRTKLSTAYRIRRRITQSFQPYYTAPPKPEPVIVKPKPVSKPSFIPELGVQLIMTQPLDRFSNIVNAGLGISIDATAKELYRTNFFVTANIRLSSFFIQNTDINYFIMSMIGIRGGYEFTVYPNISLSPWLTGGYIMHRINDDARGNTFNYYDPFIELGGTARYYLTDRISLTFSPSYVMFFEHGSDTGSYLQFGFGAATLF